MTSVELFYKAKASLDRAIHSSGVGQAAQLQEAETYLSMAKVAASIEKLLSQPMTSDDLKTIHEGRMSFYEDSGAPEWHPDRDRQRVEAMTKALLGIIKAWEEIYMEIPATKENLGRRAEMRQAIHHGRMALYDHTDTPMGDMP